ncbi:uncharacterized protein LOC144220008 [Crocuta crocuta]
MNAWHLTRAHCCASLHSCSLCGTGRPRHHSALPRGQGPGPARRVERRHLHPEGGLRARTFPQVGAREVLQAGEEAQGPQSSETALCWKPLTPRPAQRAASACQGVLVLLMEVAIWGSAGALRRMALSVVIASRS